MEDWWPTSVIRVWLADVLLMVMVLSLEGSGVEQLGGVGGWCR